MRLKLAWEKKLLITQKSIEGLENPDVFRAIADRQAKVSLFYAPWLLLIVMQLQVLQMATVLYGSPDRMADTRLPPI